MMLSVVPVIPWRSTACILAERTHQSVTTAAVLGKSTFAASLSPSEAMDQAHSPRLTSVFSVRPKLEKTMTDASQQSKNGSPVNGSQKQTRLDKLRHNSWKRKKAKGLNDKILKEVTNHSKRLGAEGRKETKSAAQLVGGK